jgi:hypothetical protein
VSFDCPSNDIGPERPSYFAVMLASPNPAADVVFPSNDLMVCGAEYPSKEVHVFTYREGAFFGNLFSDVTAQSLDDQSPSTEPNEIVGDQYACYSDVWDDGAAYLSGRICAGPTSTCFAHGPLPCLWQRGSPSRVPALLHRCAGETCDEQSYRGCSWDSSWRHAITVFLNHPCDLSDLKANPKLCHYAGSPPVSLKVPSCSTIGRSLMP